MLRNTSAHWGVSLWGVLVSIGIDVRPVVETKVDPWHLTSRKGVQNWVDRYLAFDEDGNLLRRSILVEV